MNPPICVACVWGGAVLSVIDGPGAGLGIGRRQLPEPGALRNGRYGRIGPRAVGRGRALFYVVDPGTDEVQVARDRGERMPDVAGFFGFAARPHR